MSYNKIIDGMGLGYGSKYQLLRLLGWHRNDFNKRILDSVGLLGNINWIDFGYNGSQDKELLNFDFIPEISEEWKQFWVCGNTGINWDAVGILDDGTYILVEAKAHIDEVRNYPSGSCRSQEKNNLRIKAFLEKYNIDTTVEAICNGHYQLANRLVALDFLISRGYKAKLVYVLFENGYELNTPYNKSTMRDEWLREFDNTLSKLGFDDTKVSDLINLCIINCNIKET